MARNICVPCDCTVYSYLILHSSRLISNNDAGGHLSPHCTTSQRTWWDCSQNAPSPLSNMIVIIFNITIVKEISVEEAVLVVALLTLQYLGFCVHVDTQD